MADRKKILVVDDHFEMLEFLRSMLELSNPDAHVVGVPSAEEGLLELKRTPFDLLISDVRLPGMSGFELVRKVRQLRPRLPILMITAYASTQGKQEADQLGVYRYFEKPLDTDALLAAVHATLYTAAPAPRKAKPAATSPSRAEAPPRSSAATAPRSSPVALEVTRRLQALLSDTGAVQALLANSQGQILFRAGAQGGQPVERLVQLLSRSLADSFKLAAELQSAEPFTIQYQAGEKVDLYTANIGRHYFLILLFDARARRGRIGTVWIFAQRAIKELREMLPDVPKRSNPGQKVAPVHNVVAKKAAVAPPNSIIDTGDLLNLLERAADPHEVDLDAFWEEATSETGNSGMGGLSFEEAVRRGLLPPDLGGEND